MSMKKLPTAGAQVRMIEHGSSSHMFVKGLIRRAGVCMTCHAGLLKSSTSMRRSNQVSKNQKAHDGASMDLSPKVSSLPAGESPLSDTCCKGI